MHMGSLGLELNEPLEIVLQRLILSLLAREHICTGKRLCVETFEIGQDLITEVFPRIYQASALPSAANTKDLARTASFPPTEAMAASKLMINCRGSDLPLYLGKVIGLCFAGQGGV
jgi:hypothetical protein